MPTYGLTEAGFVAKTLEDIQGEYESDYQEGFGAGVNLEPESTNGQILGIQSERIAEIWEALLDLAAAMDPDQAEDVAQDSVAGLTGTIRDRPKFSKAVLLAVGTTGTVLIAGRVFSVVGSGVRFASNADATLTAGTAWVHSTVYAPGDIVTNSGNTYYNLEGGLSAASGGPTGAGASVIDGANIWRYLGAGSGLAYVPVTAQVSGPKPALAWSITSIETAVSGLDFVTNLLDATLGADLETNAKLRLRREAELHSTGLAAVDAIRANLAQVAGVTQVFVFENTDPVNTNGDGMPPNSVEAVVDGGDDEVVRAAVFAATGGGIKAHGTNVGTVIDASGVTQTVAFTRASQLLAYLAITLLTNSDFPDDGVAQVVAAIIAWATSNLEVGVDLYSSQLVTPINTVPGVVAVLLLNMGTSPSPTTSAPLITSSRQRVALDSSRISVTAT